MGPVKKWVAGGWPRAWRARGVLVGALALALIVPAAAAADYAPLDQPGPQLSVPTATLASALSCSGKIDGATRAPVLLSPGTGSTPEQDFGWNYERALSAQGIPWCAVTLPGDALGDIQIAGEYIVYAIRTMNARSGRRISIIGHSQGGMVPRWALRFWPDTRAMVDDVIGLAPSNHGTTVPDTLGTCSAGCPPATAQQSARSKFIAALNSRAETFAGISYTDVYTHTDEVVQPNANDRGSSSLHTGDGAITNVAIQSICPLDVDEHLTIGTIDPVAYALAIDALTRDGPADPARIARSVCAQVLQPGVNPLNLNTAVQVLSILPGQLSVPGGPIDLAGVQNVRTEPPLRCYVTATCPAPAAVPAPAHRTHKAHACTSRTSKHANRAHAHVRKPKAHANVSRACRRVSKH